MEKTVKTGTTTVGMICKDGVVLGAERKATAGYMIASKDDTKIVEILPHLGLTQAGSVGDIQSLVRYISAETKLYEIKNDKKITIKAATTLLSNILHQNRYYPYMVQMILGGFDVKGPQLFILHADGSMLEEKKFFSTGSGSPYALGVLETLYKDDITTEEGKLIVEKAIRAAVQRDIASGGIGMDIAVIDQKGFRKVGVKF